MNGGQPLGRAIDLAAKRKPPEGRLITLIGPVGVTPRDDGGADVHVTVGNDRYTLPLGADLARQVGLRLVAITEPAPGGAASPAP